MDDIDWLDATTAVDAVELDIGFIIRDTFYYGEPNNFTPEDWQTLRELICQPDLDLFGSFALASNVESKLTSLIDYYKDVVRLADKHGKNIQNQQSYFWLRPLIFRRDEFTVSFPWYDTYTESVRFLDDLACPAEGEVFWDRDQCWELSIYAQDDRLYIREWNPDDEEEHVGVNCPTDQLCGQVVGVRERFDRVMDQLRAGLGGDYWTRKT